MTGTLQMGIPTAWAHPDLGALAPSGAAPVVWPSTQGTTHGLSLVPLFQAGPRVALQNPLLYTLLALVDAVRIMAPRERQSAAGVLDEQLHAAVSAAA